MIFMTKSFLLLLSLAIILIMPTITAAEYLDWHKPTPCNGCHLETIRANYGASECGDCHDYKLNVPLLEKEHNPKICTACHMGNTVINGSQSEIFHNGHAAVNCVTCHTENNFTVIKIQTKGYDCVSCHSNKIHAIHIKNLQQSCIICHGSWAKDKTYSSTSNTPTNTKTFNFKKLTILNYIKTVLNLIFKN